MLDDQLVSALQHHWEDGFNKFDIDIVMEPIGEDILFSSPFVPKMTGNPDQLTIEGRQTFKDYILESFRRVPELSYSLDSTFVSTQTLIFIYSCYFANGETKTGADSLRVDSMGKIVEWRSHYSFAPEEIDSQILD
jgi:hypothetical protein